MIRHKINKPGLFVILLLAISAAALYRCANPVMPSGGPRDVEPPYITEENPPLYSTGFKKDRIELVFNEFVELKDANSQILFSPPLSKKPEYREHGRSVVIKFQDTLAPNTTYNIFFGNAIVDLTESNPLINYRYVFSTGNHIDSLMTRGNILNAFNLLPEKDIFVMLYMDNNDTLPFDSLPYYVKPYYLSRTNTQGDFSLENLMDKKYKIFALSDVNSNLVYDLPNESIAFIDSLISPEYIEKPLPDSILLDSLRKDPLLQDSLTEEELGNDSLLIARYLTDSLPDDTLIAKTYYQLYLFDEVDSTQKLLDATLRDSTLITIVYNMPPVDPIIRVLNHDLDQVDWKIEEYSKNRDTLKYWILNRTFDTLLVEIADDTLVLDTTRLVFKEEKKRGGNKDKEQAAPEIKYQTNISAGKINLNVPLRFSFSYPVLEYDFSKWLLIENEDSLQIEPVFTDDVRRKLAIDHLWQEDSKYALYFPDSVLHDLTGASQDTVQLSFKSKSLADYGILTLNFTPSKFCDWYILQLMNEDESKIFDERMVTEGGAIQYAYLKPGKYKIKAICDSNHNGKWDTGDYMRKLQPESVYYFNKIIDLRANWEVEEEWNLSY
ncbi:MAG: Ig-like domain-containing protein [Bacteroidota bacterium]|nr:Ig-like domain-containing protein [Bacteroidota bacterium]